MKELEIPTYAVWLVIAVVVVTAGFFLWRAGGVTVNKGGKPTAQDVKVLQQMNEIRQKAGGSRSLQPATAQPR